MKGRSRGRIVLLPLGALGCSTSESAVHDGGVVIVPSGDASTGDGPIGAPDASSPAPDASSPAPDAATVTRDARAWPFASTSIWNMPIGSGAQYVPASLDDTPRDDEWAPMPQIDEERIVMHPEAPLLTIEYSDSGWSGKDRCVPSGSPPSWAHLPVQVPVPSSYVVANSGANNCAVFLLAGGRTIVEVQPFTRCSGTTTGTALLSFAEHPIDLFGDGAFGSHGGSRLSGLGGSLRVGELRTEAPRHALKINVDPEKEFGDCSKSDDTCRDSVQDACCFRWPAYSADSGAMSSYGSGNAGKTKAMKMGALLAIPASTGIAGLGLETEPGKLLAWTLQNYGGYVVDSTGGAAFAFSAEDGPDGKFNATFEAQWGYPFEGLVRDGNGTAKNGPFVRDVRRLVAALHVVVNNGPTTIGGGGTPRQPLAPMVGP